MILLVWDKFYLYVSVAIDRYLYKLRNYVLSPFNKNDCESSLPIHKYCQWLYK